MVSSADAVGKDLVARLKLGGVILMGSQGSIDGTQDGTPAEVAAVTEELQSQVPASQAGSTAAHCDGSGVRPGHQAGERLHRFPGRRGVVRDLRHRRRGRATESVTAAGAAEMLAVGINVNFAPDADVLPESGESGVADRTFGSDPERAGTLVAAAVRGYQSAGLAATVKHFPGIGRLATDTHKALPSLDVGCDEWNAVDSVPLRAGVDAGVALVMTGHIELPAAGADAGTSALSDAVVTDLLRGSGVNGCKGLDFDGVTVTDSFEMAPVVDNYGPAEAAWRGIAAGQDLVLMPTDPAAAVTGIAGAVQDGSLQESRLDEAATAVYALRLALARSERPSMDVVGSAEHEAIADRARSN